MSDLHLNIFQAYRGPAASDIARDRQLEDNLTRALMVLFHVARSSAAQQPLLEALGFPTSEAAASIQYALQVREQNPAWPPPNRRQLLVIYDGGPLDRRPGPATALRGRVDAVIASQRFLVAIESKLGPQVAEEQLQRHRDTLGIDTEPIQALTWTELARTVRSVRTQRRRPRLPLVVSFVMEQFEEYLRMNGFGGLTEEHLNYFARQPEHRDEVVKEGIRRSLEGLMTEVVKTWQTDWHPHVGIIHQTDDHAWAKLQPAKERHAPHLSVSIDPAELDIFGNIETATPYKRFRAAWKREPGGLIALLHQLGSALLPGSSADPPWRLSVVRRIQRRPMTHDTWTAVDVATTALSAWPEPQIEWFVETMTQQPPGESVPEIMLVRTYPAALILGDDRLAERLARDATTLEPFFTWLGEPVR